VNEGQEFLVSLYREPNTGALRIYAHPEGYHQSEGVNGRIALRLNSSQSGLPDIFNDGEWHTLSLHITNYNGYNWKGYSADKEPTPTNTGTKIYLDNEIETVALGFDSEQLSDYWNNEYKYVHGYETPTGTLGVTFGTIGGTSSVTTDIGRTIVVQDDEDE